MKIFVFGAGASQAAQHELTYTDSHPERAPLVDQLFNEQYSYGMMDGLSFDINECRTETKKIGSLESWLTKRWNDITALKTDRKKRSELSWFGNVTLYIWNILNRVSQTYPSAQGYSSLLKKLYDRDEEFALISFNDDTLLDQSYQDIFRKQFISKEDYINEKFIKLHGSVNWFIKGRDGEAFISDKYRGALGVRIRTLVESIYSGGPLSMNRVEIIDPKHTSLKNIDTLMNYFHSTHFYPLLFIPLTEKAYDIVSDFKDVMIEKAEEFFRSATDIYLLGYRAKDDLIHELLRNVAYGTKLHVIGRTSAERISKYTRGKNPNLEQGIISNEGFRNFASNY